MKQFLRERAYPFILSLLEWFGQVVALFLCGISLGWLMGMSTSPVLQTVLATLLAVVATLLTATLGLPKSSDDKKASLIDTLTGLFSTVFRPDASGKPVTAPAQKPQTEPLPARPVRPYNAMPLGWFLFCLAAGAAGGVFTRTNELLGTIPSVIGWRLGVRGSDSTLVVRQLLADQYGLPVSGTAKNPTNQPEATKVPALATRFSPAALFSDTSDQVDFCTSVKGMNGPELQGELNDQVTAQLSRRPVESKQRTLEQLRRILQKPQNEQVLQQIKDQLCTHP